MQWSDRVKMAAMRVPRFSTALLCLLPAFALFSAQSQTPSTVLSEASQRQSMSLNGPWHYIVDPYRNGFGSWPNEPAEPSSKGFIADKRPDPRGPVQEYDWVKEPTLAVPGDWNSQRPELLYYEGLLW